VNSFFYELLSNEHRELKWGGQGSGRRWRSGGAGGAEKYQEELGVAECGGSWVSWTPADRARERERERERKRERE